MRTGQVQVPELLQNCLISWCPPWSEIGSATIKKGNSDQVLCSDYEQCSKSLQCRPSPPPRGAGAQEATEAPSGPSRRMSLQMQPLTFKLRDGLLVMALESPLQGPVPGDQRFSETLNCLCSISGGQHPHVAESGVWLLSPWKPVKKPGWWKEKLAFFRKTATWEDGLLSKDQLFPHWQPVGQSFYRWGKGLHAETAQSTLSSWNWLSVVWPTSSWLLQGQLVFSSKDCLFPFPEAISQNGGRLCHGYSLVIMRLTSSTWWGFSITRQLTGYGSEYYLSPWEGTKGLCLCLVTKLLLLSLAELLSFVSAFSHFSD